MFSAFFESAQKKLISLTALLLAFSAIMAGCSAVPGNPDNSDQGNLASYRSLTEGYAAKPIAEKITDYNFTTAVKNFSAKLCANSSFGSSNVIYSPTALLSASSLMVNASDEPTRLELLDILGFTGGISDLNEYLATYSSYLRRNEKLYLHQSFWINNASSDISVSEAFLKVNADYYGASGFTFDTGKYPFNDYLVNWASDTVGMQKFTLDSTLFDTQSVSLASSLYGSLEWAEPFTFTENLLFKSADGDKEIPFIISDTATVVSLSIASGFSKEFSNGCTFVALLPNEGVSLATLASEVSDLKVSGVLNHESQDPVKVRIPSFSIRGAYDCSKLMSKAGLVTPFKTGENVFSYLAVTPVQLYLGNMINATEFSFGSGGINAPDANTTPIISEAESSETVEPDEETHIEATLDFDRPFIYMVFDSNNLPVYIGSFISP